MAQEQRGDSTYQTNCVTSLPLLKGGWEGFNLSNMRPFSNPSIPNYSFYTFKSARIITFMNNRPINLSPKSMTLGIPMKKLMNGAENIVIEMCKGFVLAHPELAFNEAYKIISRKEKHQNVALISGVVAVMNLLMRALSAKACWTLPYVVTCLPHLHRFRFIKPCSKWRLTKAC